MSSGYEQFFKKAKQNKSGEPADQEKSAPKGEQELRKKLKMKRKSASAMPEVNWLAFSLSLAGIALFVWLALKPKIFDYVVQSVEVHFLGAATASNEGPSAKSTPPSGGSQEKSSQSKVSQPGPGNDEPKTADQKDAKYLSKLNERKKQLDLREKELNELEKELHKQRQEIEARIQKLKNIRRDIGSVLEDKVASDKKKVKKLVEFYSNMEPEKAAKIISNLKEDLAVEVLGRMKKKSAAAIMNLLDSDKAEALSEKFAGYKTP